MKQLKEIRVLNNVPDQGSTPGGKRSCGGCDVCKRGDLIENDPNVEYRPSHLIVEITNQCNLDCIMCERRQVRPDDLMSKGTFDVIADNFFDYPLAIELSGLGEPTLSPIFRHAASRVYEKNKILYFPTNGAGLLKISDSLQDSDQTRVSLSIDAASEETYGKVRVDKKGRPGDWKGLLTTIRSFRKKFPNVRLTSCFTAGAYNIDEFPLFVERAVEWGLNSVAFKPVRCWDISLEQNSLRYRKKRTEAAIYRAQEIAGINGLPLHIEYPVYAEHYENSGENQGFINYLDIVPLGLLECGGSDGSGTGGTTSATFTGTYPETTTAIEGLSLDQVPEIIDLGKIVKSQKAPVIRRNEKTEVVMTNEVMVILTDGTICTCGAKHAIGHISKDNYLTAVRDPSYQSHLLARATGIPLMSKWCRSCEKMF